MRASSGPFHTGMTAAGPQADPFAEPRAARQDRRAPAAEVALQEVAEPPPLLGVAAHPLAVGRVHHDQARLRRPAGGQSRRRPPA